jgi:serine/threonine protein kinase
MPLAFGKYEPLDEIGDGGFGKVLSCIDSTTGRHYAIKIIRTDLIADREVLARFRREINVLKAVHHPNVIRIHEDNLATEPHFPAFVMDLGEWSLRLYLDRNRGDLGRLDQKPLLPRDEAKNIIERVFDGVEALHQNTPAVVHRDIKPENILRLANGSWAIADFGLAKFLPPSVVSTSFTTGSRKAMGTSGYAAPEQFKDFRSACHTADIYSLGVLVWELFSPAWGQLDRSDTELPDELSRIVLKATEKRTENRYASVMDLRSEFLAALK